MSYGNLLWVLAVFGLTNGLATAGVFSPLWAKLKKSKNWFLHQLGEMIECPKCLGFWVGGAFSHFYHSPTSNMFVDMCLASATTWLLYSVCCRLIGVCRA